MTSYVMHAEKDDDRVKIICSDMHTLEKNMETYRRIGFRIFEVVIQDD